jgi:zinc transporter ZupT
MVFMTISRKLGILVIFGVPAIIGGGIVYYLFQGYTPVIIYEILLGFAALGFISK